MVASYKPPMLSWAQSGLYDALQAATVVRNVDDRRDPDARGARNGNHHQDRRAGTPVRAFRSWPSVISGCTSRGWAATPTHEIPIIVRGEGCLRLRRARQPLPRRRSRPCSASTPATAAPSSARPPRARSTSSTSTRSGATPIRGRSSSPPGSPSLAPGDLNRVFFTSGGSEAVESAIKLARNYHRAPASPRKTQDHHPRGRLPRDHPRGARRDRDHRPADRTFEPLAPGGCHVPNTNSYRWPADRDPLWAADAIEERIVFEGPDTVAAVILEPLQNAGGCIPPPGGLLPAGARDLRPPRRAADLRRGDLRLGPARPLLRLRALRLPARHHHHRPRR